MKHLLYICFVSLFIACGGSADSTIAGIDASQGCGEYSATGDFSATVLKNTCPFEVGDSFFVHQNGCSLTISGLATNGTDIDGLINSDGDFGFEIIQLEGNKTWTCVSNFEQSSQYAYQVNCVAGANLCHIAGD